MRCPPIRQPVRFAHFRRAAVEAPRIFAVGITPRLPPSFLPRYGERLAQGGPIRVLAALYLGQIIDDRPIAVVGIGLHRLALRLKTKALSASADPEVRDELAIVLSRGRPFLQIRQPPLRLAYQVAQNERGRRDNPAASSPY